MASKFETFLVALAEVCDNYEKEHEEEKAEKRAAFETEDKVYNRGSVMAAMAEKGWDSYDMRTVLNEVSTPEQAEAAVGLVRSGKYDAYDIRRLLQTL